MSSQLSVLSKLCIMNTLLHFLLLFQFCSSLRNISLGDCILGKSNVIITVGWLRWRHQRAPLFSLASGPPNPKPTTDNIIEKHKKNFFEQSKKQRELSPKIQIRPQRYRTAHMKIELFHIETGCVSHRNGVDWHVHCLRQLYHPSEVKRDGQKTQSLSSKKSPPFTNRNYKNRPDRHA